MIDIEKRSKIANGVKSVKNIYKNGQSFTEISPVQKEVPPSITLQDHVCEYQNPLE